MKDPEWPDKSDAKRERQRRAYERVFSEWRHVLRVREEEGRHASPEYLADLILRYGVPDFAREYVAWRQTNSLPRGPPIPPPRRPLTSDELDLAIASGVHWNTGTICIVSDGLTLDQYRSVRAVQRRHARYAAFETCERPRAQNLPRLKYIQSLREWKVKSPKAEARRRVGRKRGHAPATLRDWERQLREGPREIR